MPVTRQGQQVTHAPIEQFGQGVLKERQRAGLFADIMDDGGHQFRLDLDADSLGRTDDRLVQLLGREWQDDLGALAHHLAGIGIQQRPVVEVSPQRADNAHPATRVAYGRGKALQEMDTGRLVRE